MRYRPWIEQAFVVGANGLGWFGVAFILYGCVGVVTHENWQPLESITKLLSEVLTLSGTALTAGSVYFYSTHPAKPWEFSRYFLAPMIILACLVVAICIHWWTIPPIMLNGFAIVGLAGALIRLRPSLHDGKA